MRRLFYQKHALRFGRTPTFRNVECLSQNFELAQHVTFAFAPQL